MKLTWSKDAGGVITFSGEVTAHDLQRLDLDPMDRALLDETVENASDFLLMVEMVFRRREEQAVRDVDARLGAILGRKP